MPRLRLSLIWTLLVLAACTHTLPYRTKYLADPSVSPEIKQAIRKGIVIEGMCPFEAIAAAGTPGGLYEVTPDPKKWPSNIMPLAVINAQCEKPDNSIIWLRFKNRTQFNTREPLAFHVRFERGRAVLITRTHRISLSGA